jgi:3-deoxy-D-manno-octulosonic-acid transferase
MFVLYEVLLYLAFVVALPWFIVVGILRGKYLSNFGVRLGVYRDAPSKHDLWLHAVSVGEVLAARPVIEKLVERRPDLRLVITTTTITGQHLAQRLFPAATVAYFPFDFSFAVRRFLDHFSPRAFANMETEIWPNVARLAGRRGLKMVLANGRISDRSFPRYLALRPILKKIFSWYSAILARDHIDRERFVAIGAPPERVEVSGNVKFDFHAEGKVLEVEEGLRRMIGQRHVFIAGSTVEGEDELLIPELPRWIEALNCFVIVAPRKPERFEIVAGLLAASPVRFVRRTEIERRERDPEQPVDLLLLDSFGELATLYRYADAAFVGGSLVPAGGHNPIEPAAVGAPVAFGPHMSNFREIAATFLEQNAAVEVRDVTELEAFVRRMIEDPAAREACSRRGRETVERNRGAAERTANRILELLD